MKNWEPFVFGPAFAMDKRPGLVCFFWKFSSDRHNDCQLLRCGISQSSLTGEFFPVNRLAASAITPGEIASLEHEVFNHAVKFRTLVSKDMAAFILKAHCQFTEILAGLWHDVVVELENNALRCGVADFDIELSHPAGLKSIYNNQLNCGLT